MKKLIFSLLVLLAFNTKAQINSYPINFILAGPGQKNIDINNDAIDDYTFDILTLSPGVYAARVLPIGSSKILDNSTFGYPDTLNLNDSIKGYFHSNTGVLGTFNNAGQFRGAGNKFLGLKLNAGGMDYLGWIELNCNFNRDTLKLIACGYNTQANVGITAGQTILNGINNYSLSSPVFDLFPNPCTKYVQLVPTNKTQHQLVTITIYDPLGNAVLQTHLSTLTENGIDISQLPNGIYSVQIETLEGLFSKKLVIEH